ncbi:MAG: flagellar hook-associated protein FlgK [Pseudomonadota bacterium]|uniref:Flagellar hook-associated protein 1 n=1 Tax=Qipengyuania flava TaxID=192812 RepID=A0A3T1CKY9_9SPHN|nr:flagellar hook-associated protein FlgK [Qipengyuania flava]MEC7422357.1 flagellar hook-associated protein FlgK [Pseudomonadota bacterium]MBW3169159.1 flagellar hook-associated protein FlgK [Qipengyuania flava]MBY5966397.1 flagellar hook-associated protein FlgK [Qipengyuania flava]MBY6012721.1 flagellar hook-associated protein FlgK [Qipengyuania flava]MBY6027163.1 flagellar hook-associated protein FlgK [Qipengyuania flava]
MASDLLSIAASGARAARSALDVTAQNIANASSDGYVRRSLRIEEVSASGGAGRIGDISLSGARVAEIRRNADAFLQGEVRRTSGDLQRANVELSGLQNMESALEQSGVFTAVVEFEAVLQQLSSDPVDPSRRAAVVAEASTLANKFNITASGFDAVGDGLRFDAEAEVNDANIIGAELARVNLRLTRAGSGSSDRAALLDQRDQLLERLGGFSSLTTSFAADGTVAVSLGSNPPRSFVQGGTAGTLTSATAADGTLSFAVDGQAMTPGSGSLEGASLALTELASLRQRLDTVAAGIADTVNNAQAAGVALDGTQGQPIFAGTTAGTLRVVMTGGAGLATAPAGAAAGSRDDSNLNALRQSLTALDPAQQLNGVLFDVSSKVAGRAVTQSALDTIATSARISLEQQSGVDLDTEAANLIRFQQAFQASGRAMQAASDIFDTLLGIGR